MIIKIFVVVVAAIVISLALIQNTGKWARLLQMYYIAQSNKHHGNSGGWDEPWRLILFKALVIFFGLMGILGVYIIAFS